MNVTISGRHMEVTDALRAYIENGLAKVRTHFQRVIDVDVVLSVEKRRHIAEFNLHANGLRIHGKESSTDMYASVDAVLDKLDKQVRKHKGRINRHKPQHARELRDYSHHVIQVDHGETHPETDEQQREPGHHVIEHEKLSMKPMTVEDAAMQLDLIGDSFVVFVSAATQQVNVIYAREDGTYGLIEPQF